MEPRAYLLSVREMEERIRLKQDQVRRLNESLQAFSAPMDREVVSHTRNVDVMAEAIARIADLKAEIGEDIGALLLRTRQVYALFDQLPTAQAMILTERYMKGLPVRKIAEEMHITDRYARMMLAEAEEAFGKAFVKVAKPL